MSTESTAPQPNPIVVKAAAGLRRRRRGVGEPVPAKLYAPDARQLDLFDPIPSEDQP